MGDRTEISWTDATWNPIEGCSRVSEGCRHCYAESVAARFSDPGQHYHGLAQRTAKGPRWTNAVRFAGDTRLTQPLRWSRPRLVFVNSMSDLFHEQVPDEWIDDVFAIMAMAPRHIFQVLTKRPERMQRYMADRMTPLQRIHERAAADVTDAIARRFQPLRGAAATPYSIVTSPWPLPNVWLGVSVENQDAAAERIPRLLQTPAVLRFLSCEPLLGPLDLRHWMIDSRIGWIIVGGESGPHARPMHPGWPEALRDQCIIAGIPLHFKQWGAWKDGSDFAPDAHAVAWDGRHWPMQAVSEMRCADPPPYDLRAMRRVTKAAAGRELDGRIWDEMPVLTTTKEKLP